MKIDFPVKMDDLCIKIPNFKAKYLQKSQESFSILPNSSKYIILDVQSVWLYINPFEKKHIFHGYKSFSICLASKSCINAYLHGNKMEFTDKLLLVASLEW